MNPIARVAAAALVAAVAVGGSLYLIGRDGGIGGPLPPAPTASPGPSAIPTTPPTRAPFIGACLLVSSAEVIEHAGNAGLGAFPSELEAGNESTCVFSDGGGEVVLRLTHTSTGGAAAFNAAKDEPGMESVADLGDDAVFDPGTVTLYVLQGEQMLRITANAYGKSGTESLAAERAIATLAVGRI